MFKPFHFPFFTLKKFHYCCIQYNLISKKFFFLYIFKNLFLKMSSKMVVLKYILKLLTADTFIFLSWIRIGVIKKANSFLRSFLLLILPISFLETLVKHCLSSCFFFFCSVIKPQTNMLLFKFQLFNWSIATKNITVLHEKIEDECIKIIQMLILFKILCIWDKSVNQHCHVIWCLRASTCSVLIHL